MRAMDFIESKELKKRIDRNENVLIVDVREPYEIEVCQLEDTVQIPMGELIDRRSELPIDVELVIMCRTGKRAEAIANILRTDYGFKNLLVLSGGLTQWAEVIEPELELY